MVFLQWVYPTDAIIKMLPVGHDPRILESVYKVVEYPLPEDMARFTLATGLSKIAPETRFSPAFGHA